MPQLTHRLVPGPARPDPPRGTGHRTPRPAGARLPGVLVLVAPPAAAAGRGRVPRGRGGRARIRPLLEAGGGGGVPDDRAGGGQRGRGGGARRAFRGGRRARLGRDDRRALGAAETGRLPRGRPAERAVHPARRPPPQRGLRRDRRGGGVLRLLLPGARPGRAGDRAGRTRLAGKLLRRALGRHDAHGRRPPPGRRPALRRTRGTAARPLPHAAASRPGSPRTISTSTPGSSSAPD